MESQLLAEISLEKQRNTIPANLSSAILEGQSNLKSPKQPKSPEPIGSNNTPADMLVSELFESFKAKSSKPTPKSLTLDTNNPPGHATYENTENAKQETSGVDFKVNLRKVVKKPANLEEDSSSAKSNSQILDFKSNLRKKSDQSEKSTSGSKADPLGAAATTTNQGNLLKGINKKFVRRCGIEPILKGFLYSGRSNESISQLLWSKTP